MDLQKLSLGLEDVGANFDYYAFSDQDDIWENNKIEDAVKEISKFDFSKPVLFVPEQHTSQMILQRK